MQWIPAYIYDVLQRTFSESVIYWLSYLTIAKNARCPRLKDPKMFNFSLNRPEVVILAQNWNISEKYTWNISMETFYIEREYPYIRLPFLKFSLYYIIPISIKLSFYPEKSRLYAKKNIRHLMEGEKNEEIIIA